MVKFNIQDRIVLDDMEMEFNNIYKKVNKW